MPKQHRRPCATCPFTNKSKPGETGYSPVTVFVGQVFLPYRIACHEAIDYGDPGWKLKSDEVVQCVGHAMMRDVEGVAERMPSSLLHVEHDPTVGAFTGICEFWAHHEQITVEQAEVILTEGNIQRLCEAELQRGGARII